MTAMETKNEQQLLEVVKTLDPNLYMIKIALQETGVNPELIPAIIRTIGNLSLGTGYGKVQIFMENWIITTVKPEETVQIKKPARANET